MSNADAFHDQDDRARHERIKAPRPYRFGARRPIEGLPETLPDPVKAYLDVLPEGRVVGFPLAPLDRTGIPVWFVALFLDDPFFVGAMPSGIGYGATDDEALIGAVAEIAENLMPSLAVLPRAKERASYTDLARVYGAKSVTDPLTLCLPAGSPVGRDTVLEWTPSIRHATGEIVLMPLDVAATDYFELSEGYKPFTNLITNGLGAGPDVPFALGHGVLELLQRDGNGLLFRALDQGVMLDLDGIGPENAAMLARLKELGIRALPKFATDQFGLTNLYVVGYDEDPARTPAPIALSACGEACDPDRERALRKALLEFQAARVRKTFGHGPLDMAATVTPPGYVDARSSRRRCPAWTSRRAAPSRPCSNGSRCRRPTCAACWPTRSIPSGARSASPSCPRPRPPTATPGEDCLRPAPGGGVRRALRRLYAPGRRGRRGEGDRAGARSRDHELLPDRRAQHEEASRPRPSADQVRHRERDPAAGAPDP
ncbi:YcaO-like family protein [Methylobacterium sp. NMS12]